MAIDWFLRNHCILEGLVVALLAFAIDYSRCNCYNLGDLQDVDTGLVSLLVDTVPAVVVAVLMDNPVRNESILDNFVAAVGGPVVVDTVPGVVVLVFVAMPAVV